MTLEEQLGFPEVAFGNCAECLRLFATLFAAKLVGDTPAVVELRAVRGLHLLAFHPEIHAA